MSLTNKKLFPASSNDTLSSPKLNDFCEDSIFWMAVNGPLKREEGEEENEKKKTRNFEGK